MAIDRSDDIGRMRKGTGVTEASPTVRLDLFDSSKGLDRGRRKHVEAAWYVVKMLFFLTAIPWPSRLKVALLRGFGAQIGAGVLIRPRVNIHMPWKLAVGDHCWIGEETWILNLEPVVVGSHCTISQRAFLCTGNHDYRSADMRYRNDAITVGDGAWIGAQVFVAPGVEIGAESVVQAGSVVAKSVGPAQVFTSEMGASTRPRWA